MEQITNAVPRRDWETADGGTVRFALIGMGWWTSEKVLPALEETELATATVAVSSSASKAERFVDDWESLERGITYDEFHDGAATDAYDAVYICTPNALHLPYAETAAELGKAVLCEKPMEATLERAERLRAACAEADVPLIVGYRMQTEPVVRHARELVRDGVIGDPVFVHGNNSQPVLELIPDPDQWRLDPELSGYGTSVMDLGIYTLNTARFVLDAEPVRAQAMADSSHEAFEDVPDQRASFSVELDDGTPLTGTTSQHAHSDSLLRIVGTEGTVVLDPAFHMNAVLHVDHPGGSVTVDAADVDQMTEIFAYAADRLLSGAAIEPDGTDGVVDMATLAAIYEAAETGDSVAVERTE